MYIKSWRKHNEEHVTLFSVLNFYLFELIFLFIYLWLPNGVKSAHVPDFVIDCLKICQGSDERGEKGWVRDNFFVFKFSSLWKFRDRHWYQLKQIFLNIKACHYNAVTPRIPFVKYLWLHKLLLLHFIVLKLGDPKL